MFKRNGSVVITLILALGSVSWVLADQLPNVDELPISTTSSRKTSRVRGLKKGSVSGGLGGSAGDKYLKVGTKGTKKSMPNKPEPVCKVGNIRNRNTGALYACVSNGSKKGDDCGEVSRFTSMPLDCDNEDEFAIVIDEGAQRDTRGDVTLGVLGRNDAVSTLTGQTATCPTDTVAVGYTATRQSNMPVFLDIALQCAKISTRTINNGVFSGTVIMTRNPSTTSSVPSPRDMPSPGVTTVQATCPVGTILTGFEVHYTGGPNGELETLQGVCSHAGLVQTREGMRGPESGSNDVNEFSRCPPGMAVVSVEAYPTPNDQPRAVRFTCSVPRATTPSMGSTRG